MTSVKKCTNTNTIPGQSAFLASSSSPPSLASSKLDIVLSEQQPGLDNKNMAAPAYDFESEIAPLENNEI